MLLIKSVVASFALLAGLVSAAPTSNSTDSDNFMTYGDPTVTVINQCSSTLKVGSSRDTEYFGDIVDVPAGSEYTYTFPINWSGRIWGRMTCSGDNCFKSGMGSPASLAEFHFLDSGKVYYDISFVDGFNLPMVVAPVKKLTGGTGSNENYCKTSSCTSLPSCPAGFETYDDKGAVSGCMSACTKYNTDEYCCTGAYGSADTCTTNSFASAVSAACPDVYSYAFDDVDSAFLCTYNAYTVTFC
jgi:hypothetical protein